MYRTLATTGFAHLICFASPIVSSVDGAKTLCELDLQKVTTKSALEICPFSSLQSDQKHQRLIIYGHFISSTSFVFLGDSTRAVFSEVNEEKL